MGLDTVEVTQREEGAPEGCPRETEAASHALLPPTLCSGDARDPARSALARHGSVLARPVTPRFMSSTQHTQHPEWEDCAALGCCPGAGHPDPLSRAAPGDLEPKQKQP